LFFDEIPGGRDPKRTAFYLGAKDMIIDAAVSCDSTIGVFEHD